MLDKKIIESVKTKFIDTNIINKNDEVLLAISGGKDSMCMLDVFNTLSKSYNFNITVCHINHNIRDEESKRDENFVYDYSKKLGLNCIVKNIYAIEYSKKESLSIEEAARILRYKSLNDIRLELIKNNNSNKNYYIALAHHKNDQAETIIHNLIRGSGLYGLKGMKSINSYYIRPLLHISRNEIEEYINKNNIPFVEDSTNNDEKYTRNFIRNNIISKLYQLNNNFLDHFYDLSNDVCDLYNYLEEDVNNKLNNLTISNDDNHYIIDTKLFKNINNFIKNEIIKLILDKLNINKKDITRINFNSIIDIICGNNNRHLDLPYNLTIDKKDNKAVFTKNVINISMSRRKKI